MTSQRRWLVPFLTIWTGQQFSIVGTRAAQFALVWWLTLETGSASVLATASLVAFIPIILLGPFVGSLVDRWNRRLVMIVADSFIALVGLWLAYMFWTDALQIWHIYVVMLARSLGETFHGPAMAASTTLMVPEKHYTRVSGMNQTINGLLNLVGAPLGALLLSILPLHGIMLVDVATAAFAVAPLLVIAIPQPEREQVEQIKARSFLANTKDGLNFVRHWPGMLVLLAGAFVVKIVLTPAFSLAPLLVHEHFGGDAAQYSLFSVCIGLGMLLGGLGLSIWGGFKRKVYTITMGLLGVGLSTLLLGLSPPALFWLGLASVFVLGLSVSMTDAPILALTQSTVPPEMQGRVFALLGSLFSLANPIGLGILAFVGDAVQVASVYRLAGIVCLLVTVLCLFIPAFRTIEHHAMKHRAAEVPPGDAAPEVGTID